MTTTISKKKYIEFTTSEVLLREKTTGQEIYLDSLESDKVAKAVSSEEIKGGLDNRTFITVNKDEKITCEWVDPLSREELTVAKWGGTLKKGANIVTTQFPSNKDVIDTSGVISITLDNIPLDIATVAIFDNTTQKQLIVTTDYAIVGKVVTFVGTKIKANSTVYVSSYDYTAPVDTEYYDIQSSTKSAIFEAIVRKPIYGLDDVIKFWRITHIPKVQLDVSAEISGTSEKKKQSTTHKFTVLADENSNYLMRVVHIPETIV